MHRGYKMAQKHNVSIIEKPMTVATTEQGPQKRYRRLRFPSFNADIWAEKNPLLQKGELGHEKDTGRFKVGDGITYWLDLPYNSVGDPAKVNGYNVLEIVAGKNVEIEQDGNVLTIGASGTGYSKQEIDDKIVVINADIDANADAIQKTRDDMNAEDGRLQTQITAHAGAITALQNEQTATGNQLQTIESKIPDGTSETNPLINKQQLLDEEMDIRDDYNELVSELQTQITAQAGEIAKLDSEKIDKNQGTINAGKYLMVGDDGIVGLTESGGGGGIANVIHDSTLSGKGTDDEPLGVAKNLEVEELTVGTDEGTLNLSITAGVATIATNNGLDIVSPTKFDKAPTTDDNTTWADALDTSLVRKAQVVTAIAQAGGGELPDNVLVNKPNGKKSSLVITPDYNGNYGAYNVAIGAGVVDSRNYSVHIGYDSLDSTTTGCSVGIGSKTRTAAFSVAIGYDAEAIAQYSIQIGSGENKDANTLKVSNANGNFEMMSADGTIPAGRMSTTAGTTGQVLTKTDTGMGWSDVSSTRIIFREWE